jgi:hypothetical protein
MITATNGEGFLRAIGNAFQFRRLRRIVKRFLVGMEGRPPCCPNIRDETELVPPVVARIAQQAPQLNITP